MDKTTLDTIEQQFTEWVENRHAISPHIWMDAAQKINTLLGELDDRCIDAQMDFNRMKSAYMEDGASAAKAKTMAEAENVYMVKCKLEARRDRFVEFIRLAKIRSRISDNL